jgi:hypothetical protein
LAYEARQPSGDLLRVLCAEEIPGPRVLVAGAGQHFDSPFSL